MILIKMILSFSVILKMNKYNSIRVIDKADLCEQTKFRLDEISKIEDYFIEEINQKKSCSKKLSKYVKIFDDKDKILIVLNTATGGISIISFKTVVGTPTGIAGASFTIIFSLRTGIIKKLLNITRMKQKKHDKIFMFANSIVALISQASIDMNISHEEFITILKEKYRYEMMKDNLRDKNGESYEIIKFNSEKLKN